MRVTSMDLQMFQGNELNVETVVKTISAEGEGESDPEFD